MGPRSIAIQRQLTLHLRKQAVPEDEDLIGDWIREKHKKQEQLKGAPWEGG